MIKWTFNFCRALDALSGGRKVRRKAWYVGTYIHNDPASDSFLFTHGSNIETWNPNQRDIRADDWEIYKEKTN